MSAMRPKLLTLAPLLLLLLLLTMSSLDGRQINAQGLAQETPQPLYALPDANRNFAYSSNTLTLAEDARTLVAANMLNNTITILIPSRSEVIAEIPVGRDPRSVALTPDGEHILTANHGDNTLTIVSFDDQVVTATIPLGGIAPYGVVANTNDIAYVSLQHSNSIAIVDLVNETVIDYLPVNPRPTGLAIWGDFLYVTHFWSGEVSLIYLPQRQVVRVIKTGLDTNLSQAIEIDVSRGVAYLPQSRSNSQNRALTFDTTIFPVVNVLDLRTLTVDPRNRITLDTADRPVNMPFAVAADRFSSRIYVANAGTNDVSVVDVNDGRARAHIEVGANPRGILLNFDGTLLFAHNVLDGTISIIDAVDLEIIDELPISDLQISNDLFIGAQLFHSADDPRISNSGWISCANCHFDGQSDGRVWMGFDGGPRNTPALYGLAETAPYTWTGGWDELADVELKIRSLQAGSGLIDGSVNDVLGDPPHTGLDSDLDTLVTYLLSFEAPPNPTRSTVEPAAVERGAEIFEQQNCGECHVGQVGTNLQAFEVGTGETISERDGNAFDTPSLRWLWLSAPYFHDGSAQTLEDVFTNPGAHRLVLDVPPEDIDALVAYLLNPPVEP
jgi:YVTN family beta-propeller protein